MRGRGEERREEKRREEKRREERREKEGWITLRRAVMRCAALCCEHFFL